MKNYAAVKRYAHALLEIGVADGQYAQYGQELKQLVSAMAGSAEASKMLTSPAFPEGVRRKALAGILEKAALSPMVGNFVNLLMDKKRLGELPDIAETYSVLADEVMGVVQASIISAGPLSQAELDAIGDSLNKLVDRKVRLSITEDPSIIGGLVAKLGDLTIDGSVRTQISKLAGRLDNI
ncbi:ATP synthase F1 subunit delta [Deltaproteobacteria bacterium OttesenSCG-928-K17]|nr:ATP synthase F1 subunit delta [Deltaproteobacteria bacterium OttesenSCG-928-K17]